MISRPALQWDSILAFQTFEPIFEGRKVLVGPPGQLTQRTSGTIDSVHRYPGVLRYSIPRCQWFQNRTSYHSIFNTKFRDTAVWGSLPRVNPEAQDIHTKVKWPTFISNVPPLTRKPALDPKGCDTTIFITTDLHLQSHSWLSAGPGSSWRSTKISESNDRHGPRA